MALINCPKCGEEISDRGIICPHCRTLLNNINNNSMPSNYSKPGKPSKVFLIQGFVLLAITIFCLIIGFSIYPFSGWLLPVVVGIFFGLIGIASLSEYKKEVYKHNLANTDYAAYQEYIDNERKEKAKERELIQRQNEEKIAKKYNGYKYKCPMCGSNKIVKISTTKKVVSTGFFGLASNKIGKTYQCDDCEYMW